jgi:hypothetical protein
VAADSECAAARGAGDRGEGRGSPAGSGSAMKMKRYPETQEGKKSKRIGRGMSNTNFQPLLLSTRNRAVGSSRGRIGVKIMKYAWRARLKYFTTTPQGHAARRRKFRNSPGGGAACCTWTAPTTTCRGPSSSTWINPSSSTFVWPLRLFRSGHFSRKIGGKKRNRGCPERTQTSS